MIKLNRETASVVMLIEMMVSLGVADDFSWTTYDAHNYTFRVLSERS